MSALAALSNVADGRRMKSELQELRRRGALRPSVSEECPVGEARSCSRCRASLGWIVNRGAVCQACRLRVCKRCREYTVRTVDWVCSVCYKRSYIQTATGEWMNEYVKKPKFYVSAADIIKSTIRRSWTICDPNPRWPASRDSSEFRPYSSLPRGRDVSDYPSLAVHHGSDKMKNSPSPEPLSTDAITSTSEERMDECDTRSEGHSPRRRISQFERTLSELYGSQPKKPSKQHSSSDEYNGDKTSSDEQTQNTPTTSAMETKKALELKPSKIPSARKKVQYTRSETSALADTPKQPIRKQISLQPNKKGISKDKSNDDASTHEKRVSFDDECGKKHTASDTSKAENVHVKSGIPKREMKSRSSLKSDIKSTDDLEKKLKTENGETSTPSVHHASIDTVVADETEKCDVEQISGAVFRKVTIKRRRHDFRKTHAFDEGLVRRNHRCSESARDDLLDADTGRILLPEGDDYKLVFISSDSSSKEEDVDDNDSASSSSATTGHSFTIDDCDWDYFEPSSGVRPVLCWSNRNSPFGSPRVYRRGVLDSPLGSPLVYRRARESDTGTDEDVTRIDSGSPVSSDSTAGFLSRMRTPSDTEEHLPMDAASLYAEHPPSRLHCVMHRPEEPAGISCDDGGPASSPAAPPPLRPPCQSCGAIAPTPPTQFVPIPVLVPIPVPVPAVWNPLDPVILYNTSDTLDANLRARLRAIQQRAGALLWPGVNQASLISSLISAGGDGNTLLSVQHSVCTAATEANVFKAETSMPASSERNNNVLTTSDAPDACGAPHEPMTSRPQQPDPNGSNKQPDAGDSAPMTSVSANPDRETVNDNAGSSRADDPSIRSIEEAHNVVKCVSSAAMSVEVSSEVALGGYLVSENTYMSSSESADSSDSDVEDEALDRPRVRRTYNVNGGNLRDSDDALPSSDVSSDGDEDDTGRASHSSDRNDDMSSSGTAETDSDDTGTVADQKTRKFSRVFVVNTNDSSSDIEDNMDSSSSSTDTSDNDTDTEKDCVVLNYIRSIEETSYSNEVASGDESVILLKHVKSEEHDSEKSLKTSGSCENVVREQNYQENDGVVLLKHVIFDTFQDSEDNAKFSVFDKICDSSDLTHCAPNSLSRYDANGIDNDKSSEQSSTSASIKNESENNAVSSRDTDLSDPNQKCTDGDGKWQAESKLSNGSGALPADASAEPANAAEPTSDFNNTAPTPDRVVSEESKQTAIDLETRPAPSPSDMKANEQCTTHEEQSEPLSLTNAINDTPPGTSASERVDPNSDSEPEDARAVLLGESVPDNANILLSCDVQRVDSDTGIFPQEEKLETINKQSEVSTSEPGGSDGSEWNKSAGIRSSDPVRWPRGAEAGGCEQAARGTATDSARGARTGAPSAVDSETQTQRHVPAARYTSLVMITQEPPPPPAALSPSAGGSAYPQVSVLASDTTTIIPAATDGDVIVRHTNWQDETPPDDAATCDPDTAGLAGYFALALENSTRAVTPRKPVLVTKTPVNSASNETVTVVTSSDTLVLADSDPATDVTVVTGGDTLSAVVCLEEGLADDDSWVEDISHDEDEFATTTATDSSSGEEVTLSSSMDQEEELRGYHRSAIDFTLHTIVEESCEESEVEQSQLNNKTRPTSATDLEKYFFFRLGDGTVPNVNANREDTFSETSSIYSEGMDSLGASEDVTNDSVDPADLASSRLEKYFLSGFMGFTAERRDSDGSVGSDSEGRPSPEQRRKRLVRARGTGRSHSSSLDNLLANAELSGTEPQLADGQQLASEDSSSSETDTYDEPTSNFEKSDGQFDTVKRKKGKKQRVISGGSSSPHEEKKGLETTMEEVDENKDSDGDDDGHKTPQPEFLLPLSVDLANSRKQQSRDSGFIGSCDDLLKEQKAHGELNASNEASPSAKTLELRNELEKITEERRSIDGKLDKFQYYSGPPATTLTRKDSFNNWSSDEETNLMMSKMRQFFKTMVASGSNAHLPPSSKPTTPILGIQNSPRPTPSPRTRTRNKPPQLVYFENELTRLMKTVPGIRDDQVREIVEYLSSEDTWSDSYDSSDYTSSDLEGTTVAHKSVLQQQISASCQQIISKFDKNTEDEEGDEGDGGILDESQGLNRETAFVYQKLVASFNKMTSGDVHCNEIDKELSPHNSPPLIAKVMHHIGSRLVALMHEVSSGESHCSTSPKVRYHHRRLQQKLSSASTTTTEDDDSTSDSNLPDHLTGLEDSVATYNLLPRSRSHDLLLGEARAHHQSSSGVSDIAEEREASDYERFSWRGSFESALMATDSRTKLSLLGAEGSASASALAMAAKRRSAGDLLFSPKSLSREQLDRVRSCGSIGGGGNSEEKHWVVSPAVRPNRRRSSVPDATCGSGGSADGEDDDDEDLEGRSTLPRSLQTNAATTNSLPRLPTSATAANMHKAHSMHHFLQNNVKSARYRPPGFSRGAGAAGPKRAVSAPGLQPSHPRREARRRSQQPHIAADDVSVTDSNSSPIVGPRSGSKSASPSPIHGNTLTRGTGSISSADWQNNEDDIDRLVAMHQTRSSLSSLGLRSDSMASVYSGAGEGRYGIVAVRGQVEFGLQYNYKAGALEIHVKQCKDLAAVDVKRNRSDPYVKVYLLPDKSKSGKRKTKVKKHTLNPVFDECLKFHLSLSGLETRTLWLTVWHSDMFGRNDFLGEVMMPLENKVFDDPTPKWYNLQERTEPFEDLPTYKGDMIVGLKFVPPDMTVQKKGKRSRGALHVLVKEAKSLIAVKANGTSDPFVKSYLLPDKGRSSKQKTPILRRTTNPIWNHTFVYDDVTLQELAERSLELTIWDHDRLASNEFLGGVRFSLGTNKHFGKNVDWMDATGKELLLWQSMLERPNFWVEGCVALRSSLDNRSS